MADGLFSAKCLLPQFLGFIFELKFRFILILKRISDKLVSPKNKTNCQTKLKQENNWKVVFLGKTLSTK